MLLCLKQMTSNLNKYFHTLPKSPCTLQEEAVRDRFSPTTAILGFLRPPPQPSTVAWEAGNAAENNAREDSPADEVREKAAPDMPLHKGPSPPVR